jgi:hypothetical protein
MGTDPVLSLFFLTRLTSALLTARILKSRYRGPNLPLHSSS